MTIALVTIQSIPDVEQPIVAQVEQQVADTIYTDGKVYTVEQNNPWAEAFAVKNGRFVAVNKTADLELLTL